jgi:putative membrane protein
MRPASREPLCLLAIAVIALFASAIHPHDHLTWLLEVFPFFIAAGLMIPTWRSFPLTALLYRLILIHCIILFVGGHYTYAEVPFGRWLQDLFGLARNPYDRIGHFAQGFVPAILAREILLRRTPLVRGAWLFFLVASVCLAVSACYEFIEWWSALILGQGADAFLGSQGDPWDTQWDMFTALLGALTAQLSLAGIHDHQLERLAVRQRENRSHNGGFSRGDAG